MAEKTYTGFRVKCKHDTEANWMLATNFSPLAGEIIVYDPDANNEAPRIKVGDGSTNVNALPFASGGSGGNDIVASASEPTDPVDGMIWLDIS